MSANVDELTKPLQPVQRRAARDICGILDYAHKVAMRSNLPGLAESIRRAKAEGERLATPPPAG